MFLNMFSWIELIDQTLTCHHEVLVTIKGKNQEEPQMLPKIIYKIQKI